MAWDYEKELFADGELEAPLPEKEVKRVELGEDKRMTISVAIEPGERNAIDSLGYATGFLASILRNFEHDAKTGVQIDNAVADVLKNLYIIKRMIANLKTFQLISSGNDKFEYYDIDDETLYVVPVKNVDWKYLDFQDNEENLPDEDMSMYIGAITQQLADERIAAEANPEDVPKPALQKVKSNPILDRLKEEKLLREAEMLSGINQSHRGRKGGLILL